MSLFSRYKDLYILFEKERREKPSDLSIWACQYDRRKEGILKLDMCPGIPNRKKCEYCECKTDVDIYKNRLKDIGLAE